MTVVRQAEFKVIYNKKNITASIAQYLISITYKDATESKSDEIELELSNHTGVWTGRWYPNLGDTLTVYMGYGDGLFNCGVFEIDENESKLGPDVFIIKGIAAGVSTDVRTKRSDAHEGKTLAQIAKKVAERHGYSIAGNIQDTGQITRETQNMETDLAFLKRISKDYGHLFSVRGKAITFTSIYDIEALAAVATIDRNDLLPGSSLKDKSYDTFKKLRLRHFNPDTKSGVETEFEFPEHKNEDGFVYNGIVKKDTKEVRVRADNSNQAKLKAVAALHSSNSKQQEGKFFLPGNPLLLAGNNFTHTGHGVLSGVYHIVTSIHKFVPPSSYRTEIDVKRVGYVTIDKTKRKKPKKIKPVTVTVTR